MQIMESKNDKTLLIQLVLVFLLVAQISIKLVKAKNGYDAKKEEMYSFAIDSETAIHNIQKDYIWNV